MGFIWFKLVLLFCVTTIGYSEKNKENASIQSCVYMDAHWLECWWEEPVDVEEKYRLAFMRESDPNSRRPFYMCTDEEPKHTLPPASSTSMTVKSCAFPAHMFSTYNIYLVTDECHEGDYLCHNTSSIDFECSPDFVYLLSPPSHVEVNDELMIVNWQAPDHPGTMLQFALFERRVRYQVSYRKIGVSEEWDAFYEGYQTQVALPPLKPSTNYEIKIEAKLDPPEGSFLHEVNVHEWGSPEVKINITTPSAATYSSPADDLVEESGKEEVERTVTHHEQLNNKVMTTVTILSICIVLLALVVFLLFYCKCISCKKERKIGKPLLLVDITKTSFQRTQAYGRNSHDQCEDVEKFAPIASLLRLHSNGNMAQEHCLQDSPIASSFVIVKENNNEQDFEARQRVELVPHSINDSISINEELSDIDDSMCDSIFTKQASQALYPTDEVSSSANCSTSSHQTYIDTTASTTSDASPYSLPNYIWAPNNTGHSSYSTSPSISSYVLGGGTLEKAKSNVTKHFSNTSERNHLKKDWRPQVSPHIGGKDSNLCLLAESHHLGSNAMLTTCHVCHRENTCQCMEGCQGDIQNIEPATNSRRNSISDHSVDSGYSPDGLDATTTV